MNAIFIKLHHYGNKVWRLTSVYASIGSRNTKLWLNEFWDEGDKGGDDGTLCRVGEADEEEGHVAEDPQCCLREVWGGAQEMAEHFKWSSVPPSLQPMINYNH